MRVSAKVDYALRAMAELAAAPPGLTTAEQVASAQHIPPNFLESILAQLRSAGLIASQRGAEGGYQLARAAEEISVAEVIRQLEGPIATVRGVRPDELAYDGAAVGLRNVWLDLRTQIRGVLEQTTLADIVSYALTRSRFGAGTEREPWRSRSSGSPCSGPTQRVDLADGSGERLTARLRREQLEELELARGEIVWASAEPFQALAASVPAVDAEADPVEQA